MLDEEIVGKGVLLNTICENFGCCVSPRLVKRVVICGNEACLNERHVQWHILGEFVRWMRRTKQANAV